MTMQLLCPKSLWTLASLAVLAGCGPGVASLPGAPEEAPPAPAVGEPSPPSASDDTERAYPEQRGVARSGVLLLETKQAITYEEVGGEAVLEGDMVLDRGLYAPIADGEVGSREDGLATVSSESRLWPRGVVPYVIDSSLSQSDSRVSGAIAHWHANSALRFVKRTTETAYVSFRDGSGCSSSVGRTGSKQYITIADGCSMGATIHEIGHAIGLYHEQARTDRAQHVKILWANIEDGKEHNFNIYSSGRDVGAYDITSIMHYGSYSFSSNDRPTITRLDGSTFSSNRKALTAGDISGVAKLYAGIAGPLPDTTRPTISLTNPTEGQSVSGTVVLRVNIQDNVGVTKVEFFIDGTRVDTDVTGDSMTYTWDTTAVANGSHTLEARAYDAAGNSATDSSSVRVANASAACATATQLLVNPGFESGVSGWSASAGVIDDSTRTPGRTGAWKAWMLGYGSTHTDSLSQTVSIPADACTVTLKFWLKVASSEPSATQAYDTVTVQLQDSAGAVLKTVATFSNLHVGTAFVERTFDLGAYKGRSVKLVFAGAEDASGSTHFLLDDLSLVYTR
jgi:hypothetical protein